MGAVYIVRGAEMYCSRGSSTSVIRNGSHGSYVQNVPIATNIDNKVSDLGCFGRCNKGKKCCISPGQWVDVKKDQLIQGNPALTTNSIMFTNCGGIIRYISSGQ